MNWTVKEKVNFINSSQNEGLSPSCIALSFGGFGSISGHFAYVLTVFTIISDFILFRSDHHWRDFISRNAHLVHQNGYRVSFTLKEVWTFRYLSTNTKIRLFNTNVKSISQYWAETRGPQWTPQRKSRHSSTLVWEGSSEYAGLTTSATKSCGSGQSKDLQMWRSDNAAGDG
jgi:hypothetical protein